jgi:hypothetical protein
MPSGLRPSRLRVRGEPMYLTIKWLEADAQRGFAWGIVPEVADGDLPQTPGGCPFQDGSFGEPIRVQRLLNNDQSQIRE